MAITDFRGHTAEDRAELKRKAAALDAEAKENWKDREWQDLIAEAIRESVTEGFEFENMLDLLTTVKQVGLNDRIVVEELRGMRAFFVARGGYIEASTLGRESMELEANTIGWHIYEHADKMQVGFGESVLSLIELGTKRMNAEVNQFVLRTFQAAIQPGDPEYVAQATVDADEIAEEIDAVVDESKDDMITVIGRRTALGALTRQLADGSKFTPETNEEYRRRGVLGEYHGARLVYLKNHKDDLDVSFFPGNELIVMGRDASVFGFWGDIKEKQWEDENWYWHHVERRDFGGIVHRPERARRVVIANLAP